MHHVNNNGEHILHTEDSDSQGSNVKQSKLHFGHLNFFLVLIVLAQSLPIET